MDTENYKKSIFVKANALETYQALTSGYSQWWTQCDGAFNEVGDRITFRFPPHQSYWACEAKKLIPNQYIELECTEAYHILTDKPDASQTEWLGSFLRFNIETTENETRIDFVHEGLTPKLDCYEVCEEGWDHFFVNSLKKYLDTGVGEPH